MTQTVYTTTRVPIQLEANPLAEAGNEGTVYKVRSGLGFMNCCVKVYHDKKRTDLKRKKIEYMIRNRPETLSTENFIICWPIEIVFNNKNIFVGFIMPLAFSASERLYEIVTTKIPQRLIYNWSKFDRTSKLGIEKRLKLCVNIAIAINSIHQSSHYAIIDYKPQNILITHQGKVSITDVDSFQISNNNIVLFHSEVATPEYAPPESIRLNPSKTFVPESWDRFSLAVSFYEILFGIHPFAATCDGQYGNVTTIGEKIQKGLFVHGSKKNYLTVVPILHNNFARLPTSIKDLFIQSFEVGHTNPLLRPSSEVWGRVIHKELIANTAIKANATIVSNVKNIASVPKDLYKKKQLPAKNNISNKKENYMIWKIFTIVAAILATIFIYRSIENEKDVDNLKSRNSTYETENNSLQIQIGQLKNNQTSSDNNYSVRIQELENTIDLFGQKYPITLSEISFNNVNKELEIVNAQANFFRKGEFQFLQPIIKYNSNVRTGRIVTIYFKILDPNGTLLSAPDSPVSYTYYKEMLIPGNLVKDNIESLTAFGINCPSCMEGKYKVEIWCNNLMLGENYFNINDY